MHPLNINVSPFSNADGGAGAPERRANSARVVDTPSRCPHAHSGTAAATIRYGRMKQEGGAAEIPTNKPARWSY